MKPEYSLKHLCEQQDRMYLLQEWDWNKNAPLTPDTIHKGSHQKVWWRCDAGHSWQAQVRSRAVEASAGELRTGRRVVGGNKPVT